VTILSLF